MADREPVLPTWRLTPGVHAAAVGDDLVFLDIARDAYSCLPDGTAALSFDAKTDEVDVLDTALAESLSSAGLLTCRNGAREAAPRRTAPRPTASAILETSARPVWRDAGPLLHGVQDAVLGYRPRAFAQLLQSIREGDGLPGRDAPCAELLAVAHGFHRWIPYAPVSGKCLLRSYLLLNLLRREGFSAAWVFGVATWPFRAHCWLQSGDLALDDHVDRLAAYTPILVV